MTRRILNKALVLIFLFVPIAGLAQPIELAFDKLSISDGLSNNSVSSIIQDKEGFIWIGTSEGLNRYDGSAFRKFEHDPAQPSSLIHNAITCQFVDVDGNLWIGTNEGISRFSRESDDFVNFPLLGSKRGISYSRAKGFFEDSAHNLYVGMESGWIYRYNRDLKTLDVFDTLRFKDITTSWISHDNTLVIGSLDGLFVSRLLSNEAEKILSGKMVDYVLVDGDMVWAGVRSGGLFRYNIKTRKLVDFTSSDPRENKIHGLAKDREGNIWVTGGAIRFFERARQKFIQVIDEEQTIQHDETNVFFEDRDGNYWISVYYDGLRVVRKQREFSSLKSDGKSSPRLSNKVVSAISRDAQGNLLIGYYEGGVDIINMKAGTSKFIPPGREQDELGEASVFFIQPDSKGNYWIGTYRGGLQRFNPTTREFVSYRHDPSNPGSIASNDVRSMIEVSPDEFWLITHSRGIDSFNPISGKFTHFIHPNSEIPLDQWGFQLIRDRKGNLWYAASSGLFRISAVDRKLRLYKTTASDPRTISDNNINCLFEDSKGRIWIGSGNGLNLYNAGTDNFTRFTRTEGLPNNVINAINEDGNGNIWVSTNKGLFSLQPGDESDSLGYRIRTFDFTDGLLDQQFYPRSTFRDDQTGNLYFGGISGVTWFHPDSVRSRSAKLNVYFTGFDLFYQPVLPGAKNSPLPKHISQVRAIELKHNQNIITFEFVAPYFVGSKKVHYAYMMEGFSDTWNYVGTEHKATYTNLDPGDYTFKVKASANGVDWVDDAATIKLVIQPAIWNTWHAKLFYFVVVLVVLFLYRKFSIRHATLLHNLRLERIKRENNEKLSQAKLQFFTNVSHEFRTPLTLILGPLQTLLDSRKGGKLFREQLLIINNNAQRLLRLVNQLLDFRKAETGNMKLEVTEGNIVKFLREIKLSFDPLADEMDIDFQFRSDNTYLQLWFDRFQCEKVFFNLLSNAFKNTPAGGTITLSVKEVGEDVVIQVRDTGRGIKQEHFNHIFEAFFSHYEDHRQASTGIGLAYAKSLIQMHHGRIEVESELNSFTCFSVILRKGKEHFDPSELAVEINDNEFVETDTQVHHDADEITSAVAGSDAEHLPKILIIEDNPEVRKYLKTIFQFGHVIFEAANGRIGLDVVHSEMPDLVICDVMMPELDGMEFCKEIKSNLKTSHIPVILLTARTSLIYTIEGLEKGADDYVTKPFNPKVLQLKVRNILRAHDAMRKMFGDRKVLAIEPKAVVFNSLDEQFVKQVLECINNNISNSDFTVDILSREIGMSRAQLYRKIKAVTGQSANELVRTLRLKHAAQLLKQQQLTISQITYEAGFTDLQYFRECFKKFFGVTPSEYLESVKAEKQAQ